MTQPMDARKTAGSKSKSTISDLLLSETARQTACQLAPQKRPNGFKHCRGFGGAAFPLDLRVNLAPQS